jgi:potassium-transporting ATPase KdpC subunit
LRRRKMRGVLLPALRLSLVTWTLCGIAYPSAVTGLAQFFFPHQANGSLIEDAGKVIGSSLIGQNFTSDRYFHGRPSATTEPDPKDRSQTIPMPYAADSSGGSNLGPTSRVLMDRVKAEAAKLAEENPGTPIPVDLVTASGSGLDPDITPAAALFQVPRVARARHIDPARLRTLIAAKTRDRFLGVLGEERVNVLKLNLALDRLP